MNKVLAEYVRQTRLAKHFSATDVEKNSGEKISDSYILRIENGQVANVSFDKLDALAEGLQVPKDEIHRIARGLSPEPPTEKLEILAETFDGRDLTASDWADIEAVVHVLIEQKRSVKQEPGEVAKEKKKKG